MSRSDKNLLSTSDPAADPTAPAAAARVAVVIPCFNDGELLLQALDSVADQEPCEVVVVDDGSTDPETAEALARVAQRGARVIRQANAGPSRARMRGVAATDAPYVMALDADDMLMPDVIAKLADALDRRPEAVAAWGDLETFGADESLRRRAAVIDPWSITYLNDLPAAALFRRDALLSVGGWNLDDGYEDWDLWMRIADRGYSGVHLELVYYRYRQHSVGRRLRSDEGQHERLMGVLRARNARLFARRRRHWLRSPARLGLKLGLPVIGALPGLNEGRRFRLEQLVARTFDPRRRAEVDGVLEPAWLALVGRRLRTGVGSAVRGLLRW